MVWINPKALKKILAFIVGRKFSKLIVYNVSGIAAVAELELQNFKLITNEQ